MPNEGNRNEMKSMKILNVARNEKLIEGRKISLKKTMISRQSKEEKKNNNKCESKEEEKKTLIRYMKSDTLCSCPFRTIRHVCIKKCVHSCKKVSQKKKKKKVSRRLAIKGTFGQLT